MGTTQAFYHIWGAGLSKEQIEAGRLRLMEMMREGAKKWKPCIGNPWINFDDISPIFIARSESSQWLSLYNENLCYDCIADSQDCRRISQAFHVPVAAISCFDDDVVDVAYSDAPQNINADGREKNDTYPIEDENRYSDKTGVTYITDFPAELLTYCDADNLQKLLDIWNSPNVDERQRAVETGEYSEGYPYYLFKINKVYDIAELLGMGNLIVYEGEVNVIEGFELI
ncbi:MAG: hypothetical protein FWF44_06970 [Defluviitaleaceae bacterium]|nr:hypothetical protein [Defluviitaleaceae bacterium]